MTAITPPVAAHPLIWSSRMFRSWSQRRRAFEWEKMTGAVEASIASIVVRCPQWEQSTSIPTRFISRMTSRPNGVSPMSSSWQPPPALLFRL